jgi:hypothetical protein
MCDISAGVCNRFVIYQTGTLLNGYDTRYLKKNLRGHPRRPDEAVPIVAVS